jgi:hypothetical protein
MAKTPVPECNITRIAPTEAASLAFNSGAVSKKLQKSVENENGGPIENSVRCVFDAVFFTLLFNTDA